MKPDPGPSLRPGSSRAELDHRDNVTIDLIEWSRASRRQNEVRRLTGVLGVDVRCREANGFCSHVIEIRAIARAVSGDKGQGIDDRDRIPRIREVVADDVDARTIPDQNAVAAQMGDEIVPDVGGRGRRSRDDAVIYPHLGISRRAAKKVVMQRHPRRVVLDQHVLVVGAKDAPGDRHVPRALGDIDVAIERPRDGDMVEHDPVRRVSHLDAVDRRIAEPDAPDDDVMGAQATPDDQAVVLQGDSRLRGREPIDGDVGAVDPQRIAKGDVTGNVKDDGPVAAAEGLAETSRAGVIQGSYSDDRPPGATPSRRAEALILRVGDQRTADDQEESHQECPAEGHGTTFHAHRVRGRAARLAIASQLPGAADAAPATERLFSRDAACRKAWPPSPLAELLVHRLQSRVPAAGGGRWRVLPIGARWTWPGAHHAVRDGELTGQTEQCLLNLVAVAGPWRV